MSDLVFPAPLRARTEICLAHIAHRLAQDGVTTLPGLMHGLTGHALFWAHYAMWTRAEQDANRSIELLERALEITNTTDQTSSLATGFTGVCWLVKHLAEVELLNPTEAADWLNEAIPTIEAGLQQDLHRGDYDWLYGYLGKSAFFSHSVNDWERYWKPVCLQLAQQAELVPDEGVLWRTAGSLPQVNLGLAHGIPSVLMALIQAFQRNDQMPGAECISLGLAYLLTCRLPSGTDSLFPSTAGSGEVSRLAWCHGDLGLAYLFLYAARHYDSAYLEVGQQIALACACRPVSKAGLAVDETSAAYDTAWCHGTSGVAHIFGLLHELWPESQEVAHAYLSWLEETVTHAEMRLERVAQTGDVCPTPHKEGDWQWCPECSLLEGWAGTGLVLLTALSPNAKRWHSVFGLS